MVLEENPFCDNGTNAGAEAAEPKVVFFCPIGSPICNAQEER